MEKLPPEEIEDDPPLSLSTPLPPLLKPKDAAPVLDASEKQLARKKPRYSGALFPKTPPRR